MQNYKEHAERNKPYIKRFGEKRYKNAKKIEIFLKQVMPDACLEKYFGICGTTVHQIRTVISIANNRLFLRFPFWLPFHP